MSRVIKRAILHGEPKLVESPAISQDDDSSLESVEDREARRKAEHLVNLALVEEEKRKAASMRDAAEAYRNQIYAEAEAEKETLLADAAQEVQHLRETAEQEAREAGFAAGYEEGRQKGLEEARAGMQKAVDEANAKAARIIALAERDTRDCVQKAESQIVEIAMAVADKVIPQHFIDAPQVVLPLVRAALEKVKDQSEIVVRVSADDYEFVLMAKDEFQMLLEGEETLSIAADRTIGPGGCVVESANGNVDARLETRMDILKKAVQEVM